jgi:hypothetical protein
MLPADPDFFQFCDLLLLALYDLLSKAHACPTVGQFLLSVV